MTSKQKIESSITKIDKTLAEDFITVPVKEILTDIKTLLVEAKSGMS
jgi:hypothetical protein